MQTLTLQAPAKVNYRLDVLRRRPDGYHDLRMIMQRFDLCDDIRITLSDTPGIRVTCGREGVPDGPSTMCASVAAGHKPRGRRSPTRPRGARSCAPPRRNAKPRPG